MTNQRPSGEHTSFIILPSCVATIGGYLPGVESGATSVAMGALNPGLFALKSMHDTQGKALEPLRA